MSQEVGSLREEGLPKNYEFRDVEPRRYAFWEGRGAFAAPADSGKAPFTLTIPPPNVTGELHLGHALQHAIHDCVVRRKRMMGFNVLCLPGTDHAGISTNIKVEQALRKEGTDRLTVGRAGFVSRARDWTLQYGGTILNQLRALGCSYDWSRTRFTLDEFVEEGPETSDWARGRLYHQSGYARSVMAAFVEFYRQGWIYRAERIVNWCPECRTTLSELEMEHREVPSKLWYLRYPAADGGPGLVVATTRPETMLGDTGVAVNPSDPRYQDLIGRTLRLPLLGREIPVVADHHVSAEFGSGAVKVTPAHDPNDWDIAQRHEELLPPIVVMDDAGRMTEAAGPYAGLTRQEAREQVLKALEDAGLLVKVEEHTHSVGHHDKCHTIIEPLLKLQWWADCRELAGMTLQAISEGRVQFHPARFRQMEVDWLESIRPWCVSRQLWWGHRIPLYYCPQCDPGISWEGEQLIVGAVSQPIPSVEPPTACPRCGSEELTQDPDVLDTWFSSALWPHATLGWPDATPDLARFYPTDLMITGRDILYLWVARMIMTGQAFLGREPFRTVLVHATVLTEDGRRMSKSLGTGVDPMELIRLYGADATRFGLTSLVSESQDIRFKMEWESGGRVATGPEDRLARAEQIEQMRFLCNKLWNISRFALMNLPDGTPLVPIEEFHEAGLDLEPADRWVLSRFAAAAEDVNRASDAYSLGEATWRIYHFLWDDLADWYVELVKPRLRSDDPSQSEPARAVLQSVLEASLRLAHPFLPFITEEIWHALPGTPKDGALIEATYPDPQALLSLRDPAAESELARAMEVTRALRNLKASLGAAQQELAAFLAGDHGDSLTDAGRRYVRQMARVRWEESEPEGPALRDLAAGCRLVVPLAGVVDVDAELARVEKNLAAAEKKLNEMAGRLGNSDFRQRAPQAIVDKLLQQHQEQEAECRRLVERRSLFLGARPD